jgi:hypothetical protein
MHGAKAMNFFMAAFIIGTFLSLIVNMGWFGVSQTDQIHWLTTLLSTGVSFGGLVTATGSFFTQGIPALITWDYSFWHNSWGDIVRFLLFCIVSIGFVWTILMITLPVIASGAGAIGGGLLSLFRR